MPGRVFDEASLLTTLPKELDITVAPSAEGGWSAQLSGIPLTESFGDTEEEAEQGVMLALHELMLARRELARKSCQAAESAQDRDSRGV